MEGERRASISSMRSLTAAALNGAGGTFVGPDSYTEALGDPLVRTALGNTARFAVITTVPLVVVASAMAVLMHTGRPGQRLWRLSFLMPFLLPAATAVLVWMFNSLLIAALVTVFTLAVAAPAAFAMSRMVFRGRAALMVVTIAAIVVPPQLLIVPLFQQMVSLNLVDTYPAVILPQLVAALARVLLRTAPPPPVLSPARR